MAEDVRVIARAPLLAVIAALALIAATVAQLPPLLGLTAQDPDASVVDAVAWLAIGATWVWLGVRQSTPPSRAWRLPSTLFRTGVVVGSAVIVVARLLSLARRGTSTMTVVSSIEALLYELGVISLASLAAFATSRSLLRPILAGTRPPLGARDISIRTRALVATTGVSFATAGILLNVLIDFEVTPAPRLAAYLGTAAALVIASAFIGWLVGEDTARGIDDVARRMRELARSEQLATPEVPVVATDEIGDLIVAANELERRIRREEAEAASTAERERIARELHDGVAKSVSVISLDLAAVAARAPEPLRPSLARIEHLARVLADELRAIVLAFRTRSEEAPFAQALDHAARAHGAATVEIDGDAERLGTLARFEILRVVEEAVRNATEHANATTIRTHLRVDEHGLRLVVEDDGTGVGAVPWAELARHGHFGLLGMRERAAILDGELQVETAPAGGTRVTLAVPLDGDRA